MERETESEARPVFDDLNPEMLVDTWELLRILKKERTAETDAENEYCRDASAWD